MNFAQLQHWLQKACCKSCYVSLIFLQAFVRESLQANGDIDPSRSLELKLATPLKHQSNESSRLNVQA